MNFYELIDTLKQLTEGNDFTNKITFGDISDVNLGKEDSFPLLHLMVEEAVIEERTIDYRIVIVAADLVDVIDEDLGVDDFYGNDNTQDVLNTQLRVLTALTNELRRLDLVNTGFAKLSEAVSATPFKDRFENDVAGWEATITIQKLNDATIC
jgi:hypothetical protein